MIYFVICINCLHKIGHWKKTLQSGYMYQKSKIEMQLENFWNIDDISFQKFPNRIYKKNIKNYQSNIRVTYKYLQFDFHEKMWNNSV